MPLWLDRSPGDQEKDAGLSGSSATLASSAQLATRRRQRRLVGKNGDLRVVTVGLEDRGRQVEPWVAKQPGLLGMCRTDRSKLVI